LVAGYRFASTQRYVSGTVEGGDIKTEDAASPPTIRQCLMHTAGLAYGGLFAGNGIIDEVDKIYMANNLGVNELIHEGGCGFRQHFWTLSSCHSHFLRFWINFR
jgi:hypothetical protein